MKERPVVDWLVPVRRSSIETIARRVAIAALLSVIAGSTAATAQLAASRAAAPQATSSCGEKKTAVDCQEALLHALVPYCQAPPAFADPTRTTSWALGYWQPKDSGSPCREALVLGSRPALPSDDTGNLAEDAISWDIRNNPDIKALGYLLKVVSGLARTDSGSEDNPSKPPLDHASETLTEWAKHDLAARLVSRHSAALFLLRAQVAERRSISLLVNRDFNRDRERKAAASHASAVRDLFPLDRRVFAARLIEARFHALEGRFDDALEAMATIQRAGLEPETRLSKHLAALVWIHRSLTSDSTLAFEPAWIRNGESGPIHDLALSPRGDLVIAGATGATHFSPDDGRIRQLDPSRSRVACHSARVSVLGSVYLNCDDGFFINGLRKELTGMPGDSEAERWARDLSKADAHLVGVDGEANCAFLDQREGVPIVRGCRRVGPKPENLFSPETYAIRDLAGAGVLLPAPAAVAIERKIQNGAMSLWTNPRSGPPSISVSKDARAVLDVEPDPLGWIVVLYEERTGHSLLLWDPKDGREVVRAPISRTAGKEQPSSVLPDGAGGVWVGYRNGALRHFLWSTTP